MLQFFGAKKWLEVILPSNGGFGLLENPKGSGCAGIKPVWNRG